jgi:hypothetical protein
VSFLPLAIGKDKGCAGKAIPADGLSSIKRIGAKKISILVFFPVAWLLLDAPLTDTATEV